MYDLKIGLMVSRKVLFKFQFSDEDNIGSILQNIEQQRRYLLVMLESQIPMLRQG